MIDGLPPAAVPPLPPLPEGILQNYSEQTANRIVYILRSLEARMEARGYFYLQPNDEQYFLQDLSYGQNSDTILPTMPESIQLLHARLCALVAVKIKEQPDSLSHNILLRRVFRENETSTSEIIKKIVTEVLVREQRCETSPLYRPR